MSGIYNSPFSPTNQQIMSPLASSESEPIRACPVSYSLPVGTLSTGKKRGRPPGSKNKPKPPVIITKELDDRVMKTSILEISAGADVVEVLVQYSCCLRVGLTIISAFGSVSNITLRHIAPLNRTSSPLPVVITLAGPLNILSLSGTFLFTSPPHSLSMGITLAGTNGHVIGGMLVGGTKLTAATDVIVTVATYHNHDFYKLPADLEENHEGSLGHDDADEPLMHDGLSWGASSSRGPQF